MNKTQNIFTNFLPGDLSENPQEVNNLFDVRFSQKNKNLGYKQDMPATKKTLDPELRKYFGYGKRQFKNIVKKPGNKFGFKLSNYIHVGDSPASVNNILSEIALHIEYIKASPVKEVINKKFKDELRDKYFARKPEEYLVKLHFGATFEYSSKENGKWVEKVDTNRGIHRSHILSMSPQEMKRFSEVHPRLVFEYHGALLSDYNKGVGGTGPHKVFADTLGEQLLKNDNYYYDKAKQEGTLFQPSELNIFYNFNHKDGEYTWNDYNVDKNGEEYSTMTNFAFDYGGADIDYGTNSKVVKDLWLEAPPIIVQKTKFTAAQFLEDELMERASVLSDNFLKHAGGIHIKAKEDTEGKCVENQLLEFFLNPGYTDPITKIPESHQAENMTELNSNTLNKYLESLPKKKEGHGFSARQLATMCVDLRLNMYALDHTSKAFLRINQFSLTWPRGQSGHTGHHPLVFYCVNKHFYLITHPQSIKSIVETCKDNVDSRNFQETDEVINEALIVRSSEGKDVASLLEAPEGHYIMEQDSLEEEVFDYMEKTGCAPQIQLKDNRIIGFTVSEVVPPKPIPPAPVKPKRSEFTKGKKGQPDYEKAVAAHNLAAIEHKKACVALKNSQVSKSHKTHKFSCNPNFLEGFPHEAVKQVCEEAGIPFHNQGLGSLALELAHIDKTLKRVPISDDTKILLLEEQECKCANESCGLSINLSTSNCDHIKPFANGGTNDPENLQLLCIPCHKDKSAAEKEEGYGDNKPDYHSQFSPSVFDHVVKHIHPLAFVEFTFDREDQKYLIWKYGPEWKTSEEFKASADWQIDFKGQYPNLMKHRENYWPKYSVMDTPRPFSGTIDQEKAGWYYVVTNRTFPFRGSSWYPVQTVCLCLHHKLISLDNIKYEWIPSTTLEKDHFVSYLDRIDQAFVSLGDCEQEFTTVSTRGTEKKWTFKSLKKAVKCSLVGAFAQKERHSEWVKATASPALASNWSISDGSDQECFVSQPLLHTEHKYNGIYVGQFSRTLAIESSGCIIRAEILEASSRAMFALEHATKQIGGTPLWRKTDAVGGMGPCIDITSYHWDDNKTVPMLQFEDPAPPKNERKPREVREPLADCIFHYYLGYKWFIDPSYDGSSPLEFAKKLVESKKGFFLNGRAGTGKTTLANAIIDVLEALGENYMAYSTTHVSKKKMGSIKSELRLGKHANTIDSLYRRWRHNQQFVITALKQVEYLLVDEVSMMREKFYAMLCNVKRAIPGIKIVLIGDYLQFKAVKDTWSGDYENSAALFDLCDGYKIHLTKCLREDGDGQELFNICTDVIDGTDTATLVDQFPVIEETEENIAFYHRTRIPINKKWMDKVCSGLPDSKLIKLEKIIEDNHSQDATLCENMPVICIRKSKTMGVDNGERFTILNFSDVPDYSTMKKPELKQHCKEKKLKCSGKKELLLERLLEASSDILLRLTEGEDDLEPVRVPRHLFQKHFYVAYAITYYQSQGCTIRGKYTIHDWFAFYVNWRAKYVALSRATSKENVQIKQPKYISSLSKVDEMIEEKRVNFDLLKQKDKSWPKRLEKYNRLIKYMAETDNFEVGYDGFPRWPEPPIPGEDENLITSKATEHLACFPQEKDFNDDDWNNCLSSDRSLVSFDTEVDFPAADTNGELLPFGEYEDDELPVGSFHGNGKCQCGRSIPKMATCGVCYTLAEN